MTDYGEPFDSEFRNVEEFHTTLWPAAKRKLETIPKYLRGQFLGAIILNSDWGSFDAFKKSLCLPPKIGMAQNGQEDEAVVKLFILNTKINYLSKKYGDGEMPYNRHKDLHKMKLQYDKKLRVLLQSIAHQNTLEDEETRKRHKVRRQGLGTPVAERRLLAIITTVALLGYVIHLPAVDMEWMLNLALAPQEFATALGVAFAACLASAWYLYRRIRRPAEGIPNTAQRRLGSRAGHPSGHAAASRRQAGMRPVGRRSFDVLRRAVSRASAPRL